MHNSVQALLNKFMIYKTQVEKPVPCTTILSGFVSGTKIIAVKAVTSINGDDFVDTKKLLSTYIGEDLKQCSIIEYGYEFDAIYDVHGRGIL